MSADRGSLSWSAPGDVSWTWSVHELVINATDACGLPGRHSSRLLIRAAALVPSQSPPSFTVNRFTSTLHSFNVTRPLPIPPPHLIGYLHLLYTGTSAPFNNASILVYSTPVGECCDEHVCLSASVSKKPHIELRVILYSCYLLPWLSPPLTTMQHVKVLPVLRKTSCCGVTLLHAATSLQR